MPNKKDRITVRGVGFDNVMLDEAAAAVREMTLAPSGCGAVFTPNAEIVQLCIDDAEYRAVINSGALVIPDGIGVIKAARILGTPLKCKVPGIELGERAIKNAAEDKVPVYFLGGKPASGDTPAVAEIAAAKLSEKYPGLTVAGTHHGYFKKTGAENDAIVDEINKSGAKLLIVCLGFPTQERWCADNAASLPNVRVMMALGGSIDGYAGIAKRAPEIFIKLGLEWFYRLCREPKRIGRMMSLPKFYFGTWRYKLTTKKERT